MSFVEIQEFADGYFFTQIFTSLEGRDMLRLVESFIGRKILDFTLYLRDINGSPWKHITLLEKPDDLASNYFESLFPLWFRAAYLTFMGNGLTHDHIAEFCGSIISPGEKPTPKELIEVLNFKKFIAHVLEKTESCRKFGLKFVEEHKNLHESIYLMAKEMGFKGGSWCIFPTPKNSTVFEENVTSMKSLYSKLLGNLFGPDIPTNAWKDIWKMSLRISPDNVMIKLSNTYSSYFDDHKKYGYDSEHDELWSYRRDTQVRNVFRMIAQHASFSNFYFRYKPEMLSMCGIRRNNLKGTVLSLYTNMPNLLLLHPERSDFVKEQKPNPSYPEQFIVRYYKKNAQPYNHDFVNQPFDVSRRRN